jgi:SnoaL-like domain
MKSGISRAARYSMAMSEEGVELARRYFEVFNARGLDGAQEFWHPDIELYDPPNFPDADRHVGIAAVRKRVESYMEVGGWDGEFRELEYVNAGEEVVVVSPVGRWQSPLRDNHSPRIRGNGRAGVPLRGRKGAPM